MRMWEAHSEGHIRLSNEQMTVLNAVSRGEYMFLTGYAGTSKTYLHNFIVKILKELHGPGFVFVTASTGIAACHLNGMSLHCFAGASPFDVTEQRLLRWIEKKDTYVNIWENAKALFIDEINMIVMSGDFVQLPPVMR